MCAHVGGRNNLTGDSARAKKFDSVCPLLTLVVVCSEGRLDVTNTLTNELEFVDHIYLTTAITTTIFATGFPIWSTPPAKMVISGLGCDGKTYDDFKSIYISWTRLFPIIPAILGSPNLFLLSMEWQSNYGSQLKVESSLGDVLRSLLLRKFLFDPFCWGD